MDKLSTLFKGLLLAVAILATSCSKDLQDDVNDLKGRVTTLEESVDKLQEAIKTGKMIKEFNPFAATATNPAGYEIVLSDGSKIPVYNGKDGSAGPQGTPYMWINSSGNWATNHGEKPADSDNAIYEIKVNGSSVKAYGTSVRVKNVDGFIAFEEYDAVSGEVKLPITITTIPFNHDNYITAISETDESVTMTIKGENYTLPKVGVYPMSITVIRDKDYVIKGGTVEFDIAVNPSTSKVYTTADFELDYEKNYAFTRGVTPDFISIKEVKASNIKGRYTMILQWAESNTAFAKDAAIFVILNFKDVTGNPSKVVSATPVIMNEEYVSITSANVLSINDIYMFTDETFTDSVRLSNYHEGYVSSVDFLIAASANDDPYKAVNDPFTRYNTTEANKYKFKVVPIEGNNSTIWPNGVYTRIVDVKATVTDYGRAAVPATNAKPEIGQPAIPGIPAISPKPISTSFKVHVFKVPENNVIYNHAFGDYWIPNETVNYTHSVALASEFIKNGYNPAGWNLSVKSQTLKRDGTEIAMNNNITADESMFSAANNFRASYKLLPTMYDGQYAIELAVTATPKTPRPTGLSQTREFKVVMTFKVVAPTFQIKIKDGHTKIADGSDTYSTYKLADVKIADLLDVESTINISKANDVNPAAQPLSYDFATDPRHGAQGIRFSPYPAVTAPTMADWGATTNIKKPVTVNVVLKTGQEIPVNVICTADQATHAVGKIYVQYDRLNLNHVDATKEKFNGNYNTMISTGIDVTTATVPGANFTPQSLDHKTLDPSMIKSIGGIVFSEIGTVLCEGGPLPNGLLGRKILSINAATGLVKSVDGITWENPDAVLFQTFRVTYTDIWGNTAFKDVNVYVKSNSTPSVQ